MYPANPHNVPDQFIAVNSSYRIRVINVLLCIIVFMLLYACMIAGSAYLCYWAFSYEIEDVNRYDMILKIGSIAMSLMLLVFTLKFLFKSRKKDLSGLTELKQQDYPRLFGFIKTLCEDIKAPLPKKYLLIRT